MILITGATGFIGKALLSEINDGVRLVVREGIQFHNHHNNEIFKIDSLSSNTNWTNAFDNINCIIHLAGIYHNKVKLMILKLNHIMN